MIYAQSPRSALHPSVGLPKAQTVQTARDRGPSPQFQGPEEAPPGRAGPESLGGAFQIKGKQGSIHAPPTAPPTSAQPSAALSSWWANKKTQQHNTAIQHSSPQRWPGGRLMYVQSGEQTLQPVGTARPGSGLHTFEPLLVPGMEGLPLSLSIPPQIKNNLSDAPQTVDPLSISP